MNLPSGLINQIGRLDRAPILFPLFQEVVGTNLPKSLVVRNFDEMLDVASDQFGGTIGFFGSGLLLDRLLKPLYEKLLQSAPKAAAAEHWAITGKSLAIFSVQCALYLAVPFIRDYLTAHRTGSESFTQLIGAHDRTGHHDDDTHKESLKQKLREYQRSASKIIGVGVGLSALFVALTSLAIRRGTPFHNKGIVKAFMNHMALGEGSFLHYPRFAQFLFIALASYAGRFLALRDKYEMKEQLLHFGSFLFGWFVPPMFFERVFKGRLKTLLNDPQLFEKVIGKNQHGMENRKLHLYLIEKHLKDSPLLKQARNLFGGQHLSGFLTSVLALSIAPPLINIYLTKQRLKRHRMSETLRPKSLLSNFMPGPVRHKSFESFVQHPPNAFAIPTSPSGYTPPFSQAVISGAVAYQG